MTHRNFTVSFHGNVTQHYRSTLELPLGPLLQSTFLFLSVLDSGLSAARCRRNFVYFALGWESNSYTDSVHTIHQNMAWKAENISASVLHQHKYFFSSHGLTLQMWANCSYCWPPNHGLKSQLKPLYQVMVWKLASIMFCYNVIAFIVYSQRLFQSERT